MDTIVAFVNDLPHARNQLAALAQPEAAAQRWVLVMCPPKLPARARRFTSPAQRAAWQQDWAEQTARPLQALLAAAGAELAPLAVARQPVARLLPALRLRWGVGLRLLDVRVPLARRDTDPLVQRPAAPSVLAPLALASALSALLAMAD